MFAGQGLDWQKTGTQAQPFESLQPLFSTQWLPSGIYQTRAAWAYVLNCTQSTVWTARCTAAVWAKGKPSSQFCGKWLSASSYVVVTLHALAGEVDNNGGFRFAPFWATAFGNPGVVTFACGLSDPPYFILPPASEPQIPQAQYWEEE